MGVQTEVEKGKVNCFCHHIDPYGMRIAISLPQHTHTLIYTENLGNKHRINFLERRKKPLFG